jgi:hypothetical protein
MSCNAQGLVGKIVALSQPTIVQGSDAFVVAQIVYRGESDPYAIDTFAGATASFPGGEDGATAVAVTGTLVSADTGKLRFDLPAATTPSLQPGDSLSFQIDLDDARGRVIFVVEEAWNVREALF